MYLSYQQPPYLHSLALLTFNPDPHKKVAVEYGVDKAFDSKNSPYSTATYGVGGLLVPCIFTNSTLTKRAPFVLG